MMTLSFASFDTRLSVMDLDPRFAIANRMSGGPPTPPEPLETLRIASIFLNRTQRVCRASQESREATRASKWQMINVATLTRLGQQPYRETWKLLVRISRCRRANTGRQFGRRVEFRGMAFFRDGRSASDATRYQRKSESTWVASRINSTSVRGKLSTGARRRKPLKAIVATTS